ncbi:MAG: right-handed parallel beta-helix repeat-containing protein [Dysgonomonas sp.]
MVKYCCTLLVLSLLFISCSEDDDVDSGVKEERVYVIDNAKFGIKSNKTEAKATTDGINKAIETAKAEGYNVVKFADGDYLIFCVNDASWYATDGIFVPTNMTLDLGNAKFYVEPNTSAHYALIQIDHVENVTVRGGQIIGDKTTHIAGHRAGYGIQVIASRNVNIENVKIEGVTGDGIIFTCYTYMSFNGRFATKNVKITGCDISDCGGRGLHLGHVVDADVSDNVFHNIKGGSNQYGIDTNPNPAWKNVVENIKIHHNTFRESTGGIRLWGGNDMEVYENQMENLGIFGLDCQRVKIYKNNLTEKGSIFVTDGGEDFCIPTEGANKNICYGVTDNSTKTPNFNCN